MAQALTARPLEQLLVWPEEGLTRVPMQVYDSAEIYAWEQDRVFRGASWHFLCLESELVRPGDYVTTFVGDTSVIAVRTASGAVNAFVNRCSHRGTTLCYHLSGHAERFTCPYHNWIYDHEGRLQTVAFERGIQRQGGMPPGFDKSRHGLRRLRIAQMGGLVFATFSDSVADFEQHIGPEIAAHLRRTLYGRPRILGRYSQLLSNNWKLHMENTRDSYHPSLLHAFFATFRLNRLSAQGGVTVDRSKWHHVSFVKRQSDVGAGEYTSGTVRAMKDDFGLRDPSLMDHWMEFDDGITNSILTVFPGFVLFQVSNCLGLRQIVPKGPQRCDVVWTLLGFDSDTSEQTAIRVKQANLVGPAGYVSMEDGIIGTFVHRGIKADQDAVGVLEMGGSDTASSTSRASETTVRTFWLAYREMMGV